MKQRSQTSILLSIGFAVLIDMLGVGIVLAVMAPYIKENPDLFSSAVSGNVKNTIYLTLVAIFGGAQFLAAPLLGSMSDTYGRKRLIILSMIGGAIGYLLFAIGVLQASLVLLFIGRFITGFFSGSVSILYSMVADLSKPENRAKNFGIIGAAFGVGFVVGPALGAVLANQELFFLFTDSTPFFAAMILSLLSGIIIYFIVPETFRPVSIKPTFDLFAGFKNIKKGLSIPSLRPILVVLFFVYLGFTFFTQFSPVYLMDSFGVSQKEVGWFFTFVGGVLFITQSIVIRFATTYFSASQIVRLTIFTLSLGLVLFLLPNSYQSIFYVAAIMPISFGLMQPNMLSIISNSATNEIQGQILGIQQSIRSLGFTIPPLISAYIGSLEIYLPNLVGAAIIFVAWLVFIIFYKPLVTKESTISK